jgi:hypothetical protein
MVTRHGLAWDLTGERRGSGGQQQRRAHALDGLAVGQGEVVDGIAGFEPAEQNTRPSSSGLPVAVCSKVSGKAAFGAHQEQVPQLRVAVRVALDAGLAFALQRAQRLQRAGVRRP